MPEFSELTPDINDYLDQYQRKSKGLHTLATHLMAFIDPNAQEMQVSSASIRSSVPVVTDTVTEIRKYKELLDSGIITKEEFIAKKRQLLGI